MFGLTTLGTLHTAISLVALFCGFASLLRDGAIHPSKALGRVYAWATVLTCLTGFGIFEHGGFGKPHALGVITLLVLGFAALPGGAARFGHRWQYTVTVCYTLTLFFHMVPGITETFTRLPAGAPWFESPEDPALEKTIGAVFMVFAIIMVAQVLHLRRVHRSATHLRTA